MDTRGIMVKHLQLLGMNIANDSLREQLMYAQDALKDNRFHLFLTVSMHSLMAISSSEAGKQCVEQADLVIIDDQEILSVAGIVSAPRIREAAEHLFFEEFMKRVQRTGHTVYLAAARDAALDKMKEILNARYEKLQIVGEYSIERYPDDLDRMINEINSAAPDVILSVMPSPVQEEFLTGNRGKLLTKIWYGLGENYSLLVKRKGIGWRMKRLMHLERFKMHVNQYEESDDK